MASRHRVFGIAFGSVYPLYLTKVEKKGRTRGELDSVIEWLTGHGPAGVEEAIRRGADMETFFREAPSMNPARWKVRGVVCGVRVEAVEDPVMREIRILDKLVDELAKGRPLGTVIGPRDAR